MSYEQTQRALRIGDVFFVLRMAAGVCAALAAGWAGFWWFCEVLAKR